MYMCDWVTLPNSRKLTEPCKPAMMEKKIILKNKNSKGFIELLKKKKKKDVVFLVPQMDAWDINDISQTSSRDA